MTEKTNQQAVVNYTAPRPVNIGDVFYRIECAETLHFYEPCKVCGDKRELTINGVTFKCPCCNHGAQATNVDRYVVRRYRVYAIGDEVLNHEWKPSTQHTVKFKLYRKCGHGYTGYGYSGFNSEGGGSAELTDRDFTEKLNVPYIEGMQRNYGYSTAPFYDDYKLAVKVAEQYNADELRRLDEYNKEHGTAYVAEFKKKITHDPKSN